jgi:hypothetical protein
MALEKEFATYKTKLPELHEQQGKFAVIHGDSLFGVYGTYDDALKAAYDKYGLEPFLVKQIQVAEQAQYISRLIAPECRISPFN